MINVVVLMGRLTANPELKSTNSGISYCRFTVAVERRFSKPGEERKTDFISCVAWDKTAEFISRYFSKGNMIAVEGSIQTGSYTNKDGAKVYTTDVNVSNASFTASKKENGTQSAASNDGYGSTREDSAPPASYSNGSADDFNETPVDDDLPF